MEASLKWPVLSLLMVIKEGPSIAPPKKGGETSLDDWSSLLWVFFHVRVTNTTYLEWGESSSFKEIGIYGRNKGDEVQKYFARLAR